MNILKESSRVEVWRCRALAGATPGGLAASHGSSAHPADSTHLTTWRRSTTWGTNSVRGCTVTVCHRAGERVAGWCSRWSVRSWNNCDVLGSFSLNMSWQKITSFFIHPYSWAKFNWLKRIRNMWEQAGRSERNTFQSGKAVKPKRCLLQSGTGQAAGCNHHGAGPAGLVGKCKALTRVFLTARRDSKSSSPPKSPRVSKYQRFVCNQARRKTF